MGTKAAIVAAAIAAVTLAGCDDRAAIRRAEQAEARAEALQAELAEAQKEASRAWDYRRAVAVAQACDRPLVWRLCPERDVALGEAAAKAGYTADQWTYWTTTVGLLAALGALLAAATGVGWLLWLRAVAPAQAAVQAAQRLVAEASAEAKRWQQAAQKAQQQAAQAQQAAQKAAQALEALAAQKKALQAEVQQAQQALDALRGGFG